LISLDLFFPIFQHTNKHTNKIKSNVDNGLASSNSTGLADLPQQQFRLLYHDLDGIVSQVRRIAVFFQNAFDQYPRTGARSRFCQSTDALALSCTSSS
jgi:hypothetical protein